MYELEKLGNFLKSVFNFYDITWINLLTGFVCNHLVIELISGKKKPFARKSELVYVCLVTLLFNSVAKMWCTCQFYLPEI